MCDEKMKEVIKEVETINEKYDSQWMIITIDSDSEESTTIQRDEIFEKIRFFQTIPQGITFTRINLFRQGATF